MLFALQTVMFCVFDTNDVICSATCHRHTSRTKCASFGFAIHHVPQSGTHRSKKRLLMLKRRFFVVERDGFEPSKSLTTDLQSAPFGHSGTSPDGAGDRNRTNNLLITNQLLCLLSYTSKYMVPRGGIEPPTQGFSVPCSTY